MIIIFFYVKIITSSPTDTYVKRTANSRNPADHNVLTMLREAKHDTSTDEQIRRISCSHNDHNAHRTIEPYELR